MQLCCVMRVSAVSFGRWLSFLSVAVSYCGKVDTNLPRSE